MRTTDQAAVLTLADLVDRAAQRDPSAAALSGVDDDYSWTDVELTTRAIARWLVNQGIHLGDRVAVARPKSEHSFLAVHGVLRAGGVVVPIDPLAPALTSRRVLEQAGVAAIVGDESTVMKIDPWSIDDLQTVPVLATGEISDDRMMPWDEVLSSARTLSPDGASRADSNGLPVLSPGDPAYLIFTSGSTGKPKGILHTHRSGLAYARLAAKTHSLVPADRIAAMCPIHFDMSTLELYAAPFAGATVVSMGEGHLRFPASLVERSATERVTVWYAVPFQLRSMMDRGAMNERDLSALRTVIYAGEPYPTDALAELMTTLPGVDIVNAYGPAELNVCTTHRVIDVPRSGEPIPIGRPWGDTLERVVDSSGDESGVGEMGELWISSTTMMLGYWGDPELTTTSIVDVDGRDWYRTGDLVVRDEDGTLHFHGRLDHQVKVRGTRLELQAIEDTISSHGDISDAVVAAVDENGAGENPTHLVAAVVMTTGAVFDERGLRRWCGSRLAAVAVPSRIECHAQLPVTSSGKVDRGAVRRLLMSTAEGALTATAFAVEAQGPNLSSAGGRP